MANRERLRVAVRRYLDHPDRQLPDWSQFMEAAREGDVSIGDLQQAVSAERDARSRRYLSTRAEVADALSRCLVF
jgi:hypothetical protein